MEVQRDGTVDVIVVVQTDSEIDVLHPGCDKSQVDALLEALSEHVMCSPHHLGKLRLKSARPPQPPQ